MDTDESLSGVIEHFGWYVYRLIGPGDDSTLYVGKGKGSRVSAYMHSEVATVGDDELLDNRLRQLREIRLVSLDITRAIHRYGMAEGKTAYGAEAALIGTYPGLTNVIDSVGSNEFGAAYIEELIITYQSETITLQHKALMISVSRSSKDTDLCGAVYFNWHINIGRTRKAEIVLTMVRGIVERVYIAGE